MMRSSVPTTRTLVLLVCASLVVGSMSAGSTAEPGRALFEPPDGRIYHGAAPDPAVVDGYIAGLGDASIAPLLEGVHLGIGGTSGRQRVSDTIREWLARVREAGRVPHLSLSLTADGAPIDVAIATSTDYDAALAAVVAEYGDPLFIRIGFEFNGAWNGYTPGVYPIAYRKTVEAFRAAGVDHAAYIWCYEPDGPNDFDALIDGEPAWYPGDDVVDWFGLDLFGAEHFDPVHAGRPGRPTAYDKSIRFLEMADLHDKPVMLSETAPAKAHLTADADDPGLVDGRADWDVWFDRFFAFMVDHPRIKGFLYMNHDYRGTVYERTNGWGDCRIEINSAILDRYRTILRDPRFIHRLDGMVESTKFTDRAGPAVGRSS